MVVNKQIAKDMTKVYWVSCYKMTVAVEALMISGCDVVVDCADIVKKFKGQPVSNLLKWFSYKFGGLRYKIIEEDK